MIIRVNDLDNLKQIGFCMVKYPKGNIGKARICLFNENSEDLYWIKEKANFKHVEILPCYEDQNGKLYAKRVNLLIEV